MIKPWQIHNSLLALAAVALAACTQAPQQTTSTGGAQNTPLPPNKASLNKPKLLYSGPDSLKHLKAGDVFEIPRDKVMAFVNQHPMNKHFALQFARESSNIISCYNTGGAPDVYFTGQYDDEGNPWYDLLFCNYPEGQGPGGSSCTGSCPFPDGTNSGPTNPNDGSSTFDLHVAPEQLSPGVVDGNRDVATFTAAMFGTHSWTMKVTGPSGVVFTHSGSESTQVPWNGTTTGGQLAGDGQYTVTLEGIVLGALETVSKPLLVDNQPPTVGNVSLVATPNGAILTAQVTDPTAPDGSKTGMDQVQVISESGLQTFPDGGSDDTPTLTVPLGLGLAELRQHDLKVKVTDRAGNSKTYPLLTKGCLNEKPCVGVEPTVFSPKNQDGQYDSATVGVSVNDTDTWNLSIDGGGFTQSGTGSQSVSWNGTSTSSVPGSGAYVGDGTYPVRLTVNGQEVTKPLQVDNTPPAVGALSYDEQADGSLKVNVPFSDSGAGVNWQNVSVSYSNLEVSPSAMDIDEANSRVILTFGADNAAHFNAIRTTGQLVVRIEDKVANVLDTSNPDPGPGTELSLSVSQPEISPANNDGHFDTTEFNVGAAPGQEWSLNILGVNKTFPNGSGNQTLTWDGKNDAGQAVADGVYTVRVTAGATTQEVTVAVDNTGPDITNIAVREENGQVVITGKVQDPTINGSSFGITGLSSFGLAVTVGTNPVQVASASLSDSGFGLASVGNTNSLDLRVVLNEPLTQIQKNGLTLEGRDDGFNVAAATVYPYKPKGQPKFPPDKGCSSFAGPQDGLDVKLGLVKDFDINGADLTFVVLASGEDVFMKNQSPVPNTKVLAAFKNTQDQHVPSAIDGKNILLASALSNRDVSLDAGVRQDNQLMTFVVNEFDSSSENPRLKVTNIQNAATVNKNRNEIDSNRASSPLSVQLLDELKKKEKLKFPKTNAVVIALGVDLDEIFIALKSKKEATSVVLGVELISGGKSHFIYLRLSLDNPNAKDSTWVITCQKES